MTVTFMTRMSDYMAEVDHGFPDISWENGEGWSKISKSSPVHSQSYIICEGGVNGKGKIVPIHAINAYREVDVELHSFLTPQC